MWRLVLAQPSPIGLEIFASWATPREVLVNQVEAAIDCPMPTQAEADRVERWVTCHAAVRWCRSAEVRLVGHGR